MDAAHPRPWSHPEIEHLLPPSPPPAGLLLPTIDHGLDLVDKYRGALIGGAVGDALGRPAEGRSRQSIANRYGRLADYRPWPGWVDGPIGTITDDTQMTMEVAGWLVDGQGDPDPDDLAARFVRWLPVGRGKGHACSAAVERLTAGESWWLAGEDSAGNGAAMRVAPVGMVFPGDLDRLRQTAALSALVTHTHPMAIASAIAQSFLVARLLGTAPGQLDPFELLADLDAVLADVGDPGVRERRAGGGRWTLRARLGEVAGLLDAGPDEVFDHFYNGALVLESFPSAVWCFVRSPEDPEQTILTAVNGGRDADTVAAMAGNLSGAYLGEAAIPDRWTGLDLEFGDDLRALADQLRLIAHPVTP